jgi:hypothetical protein
LPFSSWKKPSRRVIAAGRPPIAAASPDTSCGTIHVYVALDPWAKPTSVAGVKPGWKLPSALRAA